MMKFMKMRSFRIVAALMAVTVSVSLTGVSDKSSAITLPKLPNINIESLKTDSSLFTELLKTTLKEAAKLTLSVRDLKVNVEKFSTNSLKLQGIGVRSVEKAEGFAVLGGSVWQSQNLRLDYATAEATFDKNGGKGSLYKTYAVLVDSLYGSQFTEKNVLPLLAKAKTMTAGSELVVPLGGQWQVSIAYGKTAEGSLYARVGGNSLVKNQGDAIKGLVKNTELSYQSEGLTKYGVLLKDKVSKTIKAMIWTDFKAGRVTVSSRGDSGMEVFKGLVNTALKQMDPSGKTSFDTVLGKQMALLKAYEAYAKNPVAYQFIDATGKAQSIASEQALLKPLSEKFNLQDQLMMQDGVPALKVKFGLLEGALYFKDGFVNFSFGLWAL